MNQKTYKFERWDYWAYFKQVWAKFGLRALYKQYRFQVRRRFSRSLIALLAPKGVGLEIGVGAETVAPRSRTILSDAFKEHAHNRSLAKVFFRADQIPFPKESFDFIISEHVLEHFSNPVKALLEWHRVLNPGGVVLLFLPHKERTFDKDRERTTLLHLMSDYESNVPDQDRTHLEEWITRVIEPGLAPHYQGFSKDDQVNKGIIHHHVWITEDMIELLVHLNMKIEFSCDKVPDRPDSFVIVARKNNQT